MLSIELFSDVNDSFELKEMGDCTALSTHRVTPDTAEGAKYLIFYGKDKEHPLSPNNG